MAWGGSLEKTPVENESLEKVLRVEIIEKETLKSQIHVQCWKKDLCPCKYLCRTSYTALPELQKSHFCGAEFPACSSTAGCSFSHQLACIAANLLCVTPSHVPGWPARVARGFPCASSRNCVAINSIRKRLWSLKLNVALLFRHFFVKNFLHFSDWTLTGWSCLQAVGAQSSCPWHNSGVGLQCSLRTGVLLSSYRTRDVNLKKKLWKC